MGKIFPWIKIFFPWKLITGNFYYRLLRFSGVFHTSGVLKCQISKNYEPGKNIKTYDITDIVPAATDHFPNQKRPEERKCGAFWWKKFYEAQILKLPTGRVWEARCLVYMLIVDRVFGNVYWRIIQSYFCDNKNYFPHFQKIKEKKL